MPTVYVYNHANVNAAEPHQSVEKGVADEKDPALFAWIDDNGNIAGWAREDGTPNEFGSSVTAISNEEQFRVIEHELFELRVAGQVCRAGANTTRLMKDGATWETDANRIERLAGVYLQEIAELELIRIAILAEISQDTMHKILGQYYADVRAALEWSPEETAEMGEVLDDEKANQITARGIELFEKGSSEIDFESAYNVLVPMYVSMSAMQRLKADAVWKTVE